ncbi:30S ribosomal protein S27ae [Candidatus Marsarchaeota archaeon]|jgi:small subunit ribosomal protein S27Ae|nr:30S ribosomal protein S27ae [Candidatus Marsarchaeota archaeon]MCL5089770.1 30S ribosomal protein S27ae [Candidatus Marsarchaeota archaeon]
MAKKEEKGKPKIYKPVKACPKCGSGMGEHSDRYSCGRCGYTEFKSKK